MAKATAKAKTGSEAKAPERALFGGEDPVGTVLDCVASVVDGTAFLGAELGKLTEDVSEESDESDDVTEGKTEESKNGKRDDGRSAGHAAAATAPAVGRLEISHLFGPEGRTSVKRSGKRAPVVAKAQAEAADAD